MKQLIQRSSLLTYYGNYSGRHHLDATNKMILYPLPHKSIEKKFFLLDSD